MLTSARAETEEQVNGVSEAKHRGYTLAEGGRAAAERDYAGYIRTRFESAGACDRGVGDA